MWHRNPGRYVTHVSVLGYSIIMTGSASHVFASRIRVLGLFCFLKRRQCTFISFDVFTYHITALVSDVLLTGEICSTTFNFPQVTSKGSAFIFFMRLPLILLLKQSWIPPRVIRNRCAPEMYLADKLCYK